MKFSTLLLLFCCFISTAKIPEPVKTEIDQRMKHQLNPSIVIGVFADGQSEFYAKGYQNQALKQVATSKTVYEIGSITKTFTSLLLAKLIDEKKLQLKDPVQKFWPDDFKLVDNQNQAITLLQLATHTSGLPPLPGNLDPYSSDPYANYDRHRLVAGVNQAKVKNAGVNYDYSNFAAGLLGETLSHIENTSYNDLITSKILKPLHLNQTYMLLDQVPESLLAQGYSGNQPVAPWNFKALAGAGSIRSSIEDLLAYGIAYLDQSNHELKTAMQLATTAHYQEEQLKVGLGWHIDPEGYIWHNGGTGGFRSMIMLDLVNQKVVAGITNNSENSVEDIVFHLMDNSNPMIDHDFPVSIATDQLGQFKGSFIHPESSNTISITMKNDRLFYRAPKQPLQRLTYIGNDTFKLKSFKVKLAFNRNDDDQISSLIIDGWGDSQTYHKVMNDD